MKRLCLAALVSVLAVGAAGCGKSNRKSAYHPPATTAPTPAAGGNADQQDAVAKADARNFVSGLEACFVDQQTYTNCKKPAGINVPIGSGPGQVELRGVGGDASLVEQPAPPLHLVLVLPPCGEAPRLRYVRMGEGDQPPGLGGEKHALAGRTTPVQVDGHLGAAQRRGERHVRLRRVGVVDGA